MTQTSTFTRDRLTWLAYAMLAYVGLMQALLGPILPSLRQTLRLDYTQSSLISSASAIGMIAMGALTATIARHLGRATMLWGGAVGISASIIMLTLAGSYPLLLASLFLLGAVGSIPRPGFFVLTIVIAYCLWAIYFTSVQVVGAPRSTARLRLWIIGHALLVFSAVAVAVEFASLTVGQLDGVVLPDGNWTALPLAGAVGAVLLLTSTVQGANRSTLRVHIVAFIALVVLAVADLLQLDSNTSWFVTVGAFVVIADTIACAIINRRPAGA